MNFKKYIPVTAINNTMVLMLLDNNYAGYARSNA